MYVYILMQIFLCILIYIPLKVKFNENNKSKDNIKF